MASYDMKNNSWRIFQHNPKTTSNMPIKRIASAQSIMIEGLKKAFVIGGREEVDIENQTWTGANGMLIYDLEQKTWEHKGTEWDSWLSGVVNHLAFDTPASGYLLGFAGQDRKVCKPETNIALFTHTASYCALGGPNGPD